MTAGVVVLLLLKLAYLVELRVNSDEPQHLHVLWAWTTGQLPYRDVFDNHAPLFQMLWAPLLRLCGERADIVEWMRLSVVPIYLACLWLTWSIGVKLWSRRVAATAVLIAALFPPFFVVSTQFRPDDLWALAWLAVVRLVTGGRLDARRGAITGIVLGATLSISLKTIVLLMTALLAGLLVGVATWPRCGWRARLPWGFFAALAAASAVIPAALTLFFVVNGAGPAMVYDLFEHNVVADLGHWAHGALRFVLAPLTLPAALAIAWFSRERTEDRSRWARRSFVLLSVIGYLVVLYGYWPLFTHQDLLPAIPLAALALASLLLDAGSTIVPAVRVRQFAAAAVVGCELAVLLIGYPIWEGHRGEFSERLRAVLALTSNTDYVMDAKGDSIFRRRPLYWALETITLERMRDGSIADNIAVRLSASGTPVVRPERLPPGDRQFVERNYLCVADDLCVAGQVIGRADGGMPIEISIAIPQQYRFVLRDGGVDAEVDGKSCRQSCFLGIGRHRVRVARSGDLALVWAPAIDRGVEPASLFAR